MLIKLEKVIMLSKKDLLEKLKSELSFLEKNFFIKRIGLFGSYSKESQNEDSDIDLMIEFKKPIGLKFMDLAEYLERKLGKRVEILTLEGMKSIRIKEVAVEIERSLVYV